jgi:transposase
MVKAYPSASVRSAVLAYFECCSYRKAALLYGVGKSTLQRWVASIGARALQVTRRSRRSRVLESVTNLLHEVPFQKLLFNAANIRHSLMRLGVQASASTVWRALKRSGFTWKRTRMRCVPDLQAFQANRLQFAESLKLLDPNDVLSIDESSFDSHMAPLRGYSPRGSASVHPRQRPHRQRVTLLAAISRQQVENWTIITGSSNTERFKHFVLGLAKCPQRYVILDNVAFHKSKSVLQRFHTLGKIPVFIPPYSPEFNPIERFFHSLKSIVRPCSFENSDESVSEVLEACLFAYHDYLSLQCVGAYKGTWTFVP